MAAPWIIQRVPFAFALGIFVFVFSVLNRMTTMVAGAYLELYAICFGLTTASAACFVYAFQRGSSLARVLAVVCLLPVLWSALELLRDIAIEYKRLHV